jgi:hypothetical protein
MADNANCYVFGYCVTDQAWPERLGKIACYGLCLSRYSGECRGARQSSRRRCIPTPDQLGAMYPLVCTTEISGIADAILSLRPAS